MITLCSDVHIWHMPATTNTPIGYGRHIPNITQKNELFCNREQPNLFIQQSSLNIINVLQYKRSGCSAVYDKDFLRWDESGSSGAKNGRNFDESSNLKAKNGRNPKIWFFFQASLNAAI